MTRNKTLFSIILILLILLAFFLLQKVPTAGGFSALFPCKAMIKSGVPTGDLNESLPGDSQLAAALSVHDARSGLRGSVPLLPAKLR